jgi:hypothetical protein
MASNVTDTARQTSATLMETIRENPLPAALLGIGAGWLFLSARRRAAERDRWRPPYGSRYYDRGYGQYGSSQYGSSQYGAAQPSREENGKMSQMTDAAKERASDMAEQAQWQAQRARGWLERTWDENPLVVAGAALAGGALIGLSIPSTDAERNMMGEASGNVLQKAADTAQDATQNVSEKAQQAMQEAAPEAGKQ